MGSILNKLSAPILLLLLVGCTHPAVEPVPDEEPEDESMYSSLLNSLQVNKGLGATAMLKWEADPHLKTYRVLRAVAKNPTDSPQTLRYDLLGETKAATFTDTTVRLKTLYYYKVQASYTATKVIESNIESFSIDKLSDYDLAYQAYTNLATATGGKRYDVARASDLPKSIIQIITENAASQPTDVIFLVDNTGSMTDDINAIKKDLNKIIDALPPSTRLGVGGYRDRGDLYLLRFQDLTTDFPIIRTFIANMYASGGGDLPEAIYDALYETVTKATWLKKKRMVILIGDSSPQEGTNTTHSATEVIDKCRQAGVEVNLFPILIDLSAEDDQSEGG